MVQDPRRQKPLSSLILESTALMASKQRAMFYTNYGFTSGVQSTICPLCYHTPPQKYSSVRRVLHSH